MENHRLKSVEKRLHRIANVLLLNSSFTDRLGLLDGKMGIAIFFYLYAKYTGKQTFSDFAGELIDEIYEEIHLGTPIGFASGLSGIGWGIEYLINNGFVEADADEVLDEIDTAVYRLGLKYPLSINQEDELFGVGLYYLVRLKGRENKNDNLSVLHKKHHLVFLLDDCERLLSLDEIFGDEIPKLSLAQLCSIAYFIGEMHSLQLFPVKTKKLIDALPGYVLSKAKPTNSYAERQAYIQLTKKLDKKHVPKTVKELYDNFNNNFLINAKKEWEENANPMEEFTKSAWYPMVYFVDFKNIPEMGTIADKAITSINNENEWDKRLDGLGTNNLGLDKGLAGIGLGLLDYLWQKKNEQNGIQYH